MTLLQALVLGVVQGLTEFLPVSSSGHLVLVPFLFGWEEPSVAFDVAVHLGTLIAVVWVFRARVAALLVTLARWSSADERERRVIRLILIGSIPAVLVGGLLGDRLEGAFERPVLVSLLLAVNGWAMLSAERVREERHAGSEREQDEMNRLDAGLVGLAQAAAILPGISRSGATIGAGIARGVSRPAAATYSFLLAVPIIIGAAVVKIPEMTDLSGGVFAVGVASATVSGALGLQAFLALVRTRGLRPFAYYCFLVTTAGLLTALARG